MIERDKEHENKLQSEISSKIKELENYVKKIDKAIYDTETKYLDSTQLSGNIVKGFENFFSVKSKISGIALPKKTKFSINERVFSASSFSNTYLKEEPIKVGSNTSHHTDSDHSTRSKLNKNKNKNKHKKMNNSLSLKKRRLTSNSIITIKGLMDSSLEEEK